MSVVSPTTSKTREERNAELMAFIQRINPEADPTSILLFRQVFKANQLLTHAAEKQLEDDGLTWGRFLTLLALMGKETYGTSRGLQPSELSDLLGIPRNTMSALLAGLEEEGLISRELHGTDRRKFVMRLTPQGRKTLRSKLGTQFRQATKCFAGLGAQERATLLELLTRLTQSLSEMNN